MLNKEQRILISKKIVSAPMVKASFDAAAQSVIVQKSEDIQLDLANKTLMDNRTPAINSYQAELGYLTGSVRTELTEQDLIDGATRAAGNYFFPNDGSNPTPSVPTGRWLNIPPFLMSVAIGKNHQEAFGTTTSEMSTLVDIRNDINSFISLYTNQMEVVTGQRGNLVLDTVELYPGLRAHLDGIVTKVVVLDQILVLERAAILSNPETSLPDNVLAILSIDQLRNAISLWLNYQTYNTDHGQTTAIGFYSYDYSLLYPTKGQLANISALGGAIDSRSSFAPVRQSFVENKLGNIVQNPSDGIASSFSGYYGERGRAILLRVDLVSGSLTSVYSADRKIAAIEMQKKAIDDYLDTYASVIKCSLLEAVSNGTDFINVVDPTDFLIGDAVYLVSDTQDEIEAQIVDIVGKRILLSKKIPAKYRASEFARLSKLY